MLSWKKGMAATLGGTLIVAALAGPVMASASANANPEKVAFSVAAASSRVSPQKQKALLEDIDNQELRDALISGIANRLDKSQGATRQAISQSLKSGSSSQTRSSSSDQKLGLTGSRLAGLVQRMSDQLGVPEDEVAAALRESLRSFLQNHFNEAQRAGKLSKSEADWMLDRFDIAAEYWEKSID